MKTIDSLQKILLSPISYETLNREKAENPLMKCLNLALFALLCLPVVGCATANKSADTTSASTEWRIKSLEESFLNFREQQRRMADENSQNVDRLEKRLAVIEGDLAAARSGGSPAPAAAPQDAPGGESWVNDLKPEDGGWVEGDKPAAEPMVENDAEKPWAKLPTPPAVIPEPEVIERPGKPAPKPAAVSMADAMTPKELYDRGYSQYNSGDFPAARASFDDFLAKYSADGLAPNALYWKGETYYSEKDYPQAILTFKEVTARFPKHDKAASALLKIGMSYDHVGDRDNAVFYLRALVDDFPGSAQAGLARRELARLGG